MWGLCFCEGIDLNESVYMFYQELGPGFTSSMASCELFILLLLDLFPSVAELACSENMPS